MTQGTATLGIAAAVAFAAGRIDDHGAVDEFPKPSTVAGVAGEAPRVECRSVARVYKRHTGVKSVLHEDTVREALCFGWIDSLIKRLDDDRYVLKFTPRQATSKWSQINRKRWAELKAAGLLTSAGLAAAPTGNTYAPRLVVPDLPVFISKALKTNH